MESVYCNSAVAECSNQLLPGVKFCSNFSLGISMKLNKKEVDKTKKNITIKKRKTMITMNISKAIKVKLKVMLLAFGATFLITWQPLSDTFFGLEFPS